MNILIIGEFSAFAKHLKNGLKQLGHEVTVTMTGDGWKEIKGDKDDICYKTEYLHIFGKNIPKSYLFYVRGVNKYIDRKLHEKYDGIHLDLIIVINYQFLSSSWCQAGVKLGFVKKAIEGGTKIIMSVCGGDPSLIYHNPSIYKEWGYKPTLKSDMRYSFLLKFADVIIPTAYVYYQAAKNYAKREIFDVNKLINAIPLPITIDNDYSISSCMGRKIVIFHGIIRPKRKGSYYIQPAMERLQREFPDRVTCICKGGMPYDEYVKVFNSVDILIDQASGDEGGWGINASIGAMKGKCVLVSCGDKSEEHMGIPNIPFIDIKRDEDDIYETLKRLIMSPEEIDRIKVESRKFVEKYCDSIIVAKRYLDAVKS